MAASIETRLFINNEAKSGESYEIYNPADGRLVASNIHIAGEADVDAAVDAATRAFKGPWSQLTGAQRGQLLNRFAELFEHNLEEVIRLEAISMGMPLLAAKGFAFRIPAWFRFYAGYADKLEGDVYPPDEGSYNIVQYEPMGVVACISAWNTTYLYYAFKIAPALAAGNTYVIFKTSEKSPLGGVFIGKLFAEAGFPPGVVNFLTGGGKTGHLLAAHDKIRMISFTGSVSTGRKVQEAAAKSNMKKVSLELGGKSPALVFEDADIANALPNLAQGFLFNSGQVCVGKLIYFYDFMQAKTIQIKVK